MVGFSDGHSGSWWRAGQPKLMSAEIVRTTIGIAPKSASDSKTTARNGSAAPIAVRLDVSSIALSSTRISPKMIENVPAITTG